MFQFLRGIVLITALTLNCGAAFAAEVGSADFIMPSCRAALGLQTDGPPNAGLCIGLIDGLGYQRPGICIPNGVSLSQGVKVVVQYIDNHPARLHERFEKLALEALLAAWPCTN
jgi:hypothetical protein